MSRIIRAGVVTTFLINSVVWAATTPPVLPSSVSPERISANLSKQPQANPPVTSRIVTATPPPSSPLGSEAAKIKFKLTKIILENNTVYSDQQLEALYKDKLGTTISVVQLQGIVQSITNFYRNEGYILTRAILPPQKVANGIVKIRVIEGYIAQVKVIGRPRGAKALLQAYGDNIIASKPLHIKVMEKYLLLSNEIPGVETKAVLIPAKNRVGGTDINLLTDTKLATGYVSYDNYGTRYIGPNEISVGGELYSLFRSGDSTQISTQTTTRPQELKFGQILHSTPLGSKGMRWILSANEARTRPGLTLRPLKIEGTANTYNTTIQYPLIRSRTQNLTLDGGFNYIDNKTVFSPAKATLYVDHLRTIKIGGNFDIADAWKGASSIGLHVETGIPVLGETTIAQGNALFVQTSRAGASNHFSRIVMDLSHLQPLGSTRFSFSAFLTGQYSNQPLLASEQISFGGVQQALGRGYDAGEISGDKGYAGSLEFRANFFPQKTFFQSSQLYIFYDAGVIFNNKFLVGQSSSYSATSTGAGARFIFTKNFTGNVLIAQPLTRKVGSLVAANINGRLPRVFFSVTLLG